MTTMQISLPAELKKWVERQALEKGYEGADAFLLDLLRRDQAHEARDRIDALLVESLESGPSTRMTKGDWRRIREAGVRRFRARQKK